MTVLTLEINDSNLRLFEGSRLLANSPGYAHFSHSSALFGQAAEAQLRLQPLQTTSQFWNHITEAQLPGPVKSDKTPADMAWLNILDLWPDNQPGTTEVVFVVPGNFKPPQLGLLLGIAAHCPFQTLAIVDTAIAAMANLNQERLPVAVHCPCFHVDIQLHQSILTRLECANDTWTRMEVINLPVGMTTLKDSLVQYIAKQYIEKTRFDPLHEASSERQLYDSLPQLLAALHAQPDTILKIAGKGKQYDLVLSQHQVDAHLREHFFDYTNGLSKHLDAECTLVVSDRFMPYQTLLPHSANELAVHHLSEIASSAGVSYLIDNILQHEDGIPLVLEVSAITPLTHQTNSPLESDSPAEISKKIPEPPPTHLLIGTKAFKIGHGAEIYLSDQGLSLSGKGQSIGKIKLQSDVLLLFTSAPKLRLNEQQPSSQQVLTQGDVLAIDEHQLSCILVMG